MADDASGDDRPGVDDTWRENEGARSDVEESTESNGPHFAGRTEVDADERDRIPIDLSDGRDAEPEVDEDSEDEAYAPEPRSTPIEPGTPNLENVAFVLLGALLMLLVLFRLFTVAVG